MKLLMLTDLGNTERFIDQHQGDVMYCPQLKQWFSYSGREWVPDTAQCTVTEKGQLTVRSIYYEGLIRDDDDPTPEEIEEHAMKSEGAAKIKAMISQAQKNSVMQLSSDQMDTDPWLLNCLNGTIDLRTGSLLPHDKAHLITQSTKINYDPTAQCPRFISFLKEIFAKDQELVDYMQRALGYSLTGLTSEQCLFILLGNGSNGKSTLLEILRKIFGTYARHASAETLLQTGHTYIRNDIARLGGARFVTCVEISTGKKLDEALVKQLTGGDAITSRFLYREHFEYHPAFKLFLATNYPPQISGVDDGIWRRIKVIPFSVSFQDKAIDKKLLESLTQELEGILAWMVQGCLSWQKKGELGTPVIVHNEIKKYRDEMDVVGEFLKDKCKQDEKGEAVKAVYESFCSWAEESCEDKIAKKVFGSIMRKKGYEQKKSGSVRSWAGISIMQQDCTKKDAETPAVSSETAILPNKDCIPTGVESSNMVN